ncbi:MAG: uroporphyrinogen decarboxylase, partial [Gammaproteobacteria bacterium]|nr:uroporphyrinogen decarboxylase [Gammaproteobacteria bacterium]
MMNSRERVLAAFHGKPMDRRAVSLVLSLYGARLTQCELPE